MWVRLPPSRLSQRNASRNPHRWRRLPGPERGHPGRGSALARYAGTRSSGSGAGWRGLVDGWFTPLGPARDLGAPAARRDDPRHVAHEPVQGRGRRRARARELRAGRARRARRDRRRGHARRRRAAPRASTSFPVVGVPKTIDNDLVRRPTTPSASTRPSRSATEAIDRLHTTAESHNRVMVVEVMGRHTGWIAVDERDRRRRGRDPDPRAADHGRGGVRARSSSATSAARTSRSSSSARATSSRTSPASSATGHAGGRDPTSSATSASAASATQLARARSRSGPATRPG